MPSTIDGDFTGEVETEYIMTALKALVHDRAYETEVPDKTVLATDPAGIVLPYIVARFAAPYASTVGRNIGHEPGQPHRLSFTVIVGSGDAEWTRKAMKKVNETLIGMEPSNTSTEIKATGGLQYGVPASGPTPTRFLKAQFFRLEINV